MEKTKTDKHYSTEDIKHTTHCTCMYESALKANLAVKNSQIKMVRVILQPTAESRGKKRLASMF